MKKLFVSALFFASFSVAAAQTPPCNLNSLTSLADRMSAVRQGPVSAPVRQVYDTVAPGGPTQQPHPLACAEYTQADCPANRCYWRESAPGLGIRDMCVPAPLDCSTYSNDIASCPSDRCHVIYPPNYPGPGRYGYGVEGPICAPKTPYCPSPAISATKCPEDRTLASKFYYYVDDAPTPALCPASTQSYWKGQCLGASSLAAMNSQAGRTEASLSACVDAVCGKIRPVSPFRVFLGSPVSAASCYISADGYLHASQNFNVFKNGGVPPYTPSSPVQFAITRGAIYPLGLDPLNFKPGQSVTLQFSASRDIKDSATPAHTKTLTTNLTCNIIPNPIVVTDNFPPHHADCTTGGWENTPGGIKVIAALTCKQAGYTCQVCSGGAPPLPGTSMGGKCFPEGSRRYCPTNLP